MSWARGVLDYGKYQIRRTQAVACITDRAQPNFGTIGRRLGTPADEAGSVVLRKPPASKPNSPSESSATRSIRLRKSRRSSPRYQGEYNPGLPLLPAFGPLPEAEDIWGTVFM